MEKHGKSSSFIGRHRWRTNASSIDCPRSTTTSSFSPNKPNHHQQLLLHHPPPDHTTINPSPLVDVSAIIDPHQILIQIDRLTDEYLSTTTSNPDADHNHLLQADDSASTIIIVSNKSDDASFLIYESAVKRLCKLKRMAAACTHPSSSLLVDKVNNLLHRTMMLMEQELRSILLDSSSSVSSRPVPPPATDQPTSRSLKVMSSKHFSFKTPPDRPNSITGTMPTKVVDEDDFPGFSEDKMFRINNIVTTMIFAGYRNECCNVYSMARGNALYEQLKRLDFEKLNTEDIHKLSWDWLEADISRWIRIIKHCSDILIPAERKLGETVFSHHLVVFRGLFVNLIRSVTTSLLDYAAAVAVTKQSAERLFKFLDMYEALHGLSEALIMMKDDDDRHHVIGTLEISSVMDRIGSGAVNMLGDLENSIRNDVAKTPVPGGAVHPLTRYVLNYVKYACEYGGTLEEIFRLRLQHPTTTSSEMSPLAAQIMSVMSLLDGNLAVKSTLYKDPSLRYIFLMNNGRYILQKVKGSNEIKKLIGDNWCRRRSSEVRHYHKSYQRETWTRLLQCITQEGIQVNGKTNKQLLKDRFKNFNVMFEEIHKTQSTWVVSEEQLLSELRASISGVVIPAYRSFVGRYKHHFEAGRSMDRYIKYQPEDIEALIETLFEGGHTSSMSRKRF